MKQRKIAVIAGTSDATDWIRSLPETDSVTAFVATPYGKEILAGTNCTVHVGRLDAAGFAEALTGFDEVVDASHPFAVGDGNGKGSVSGKADSLYSHFPPNLAL
ncbi:MAG: precorrin-6A/cobalt-precorrin-6A reductase [Ruminococcus sp.]